jgi:dipeptidyl aminopeptidase/acylaminoacyl peptidase
VSSTFSWSPDGSFLAYSCEQGGNTDAYVVDMRAVKPGSPVSLNALFGRRSTGQVDLRWAPNGKALVVQDQVESFIADFSGSQPTVRAIPAGKRCWKWTPDSQRLICQHGQSVILLPLDLGPPTTLTGALEVQYGNLTPDGTALVFDSRAGDGLLYFSRLADAVPHPVPLNPIPVGRGTSYSWVNDGALIYIASNVSLNEHEIYRASYSDPSTVEALVTGIDTSATGMDSRDIRPQLLPGGKLLAYQSPGYEAGTLEFNVRELASGRETSWTVGARSYIITSKDGTLALVPQLYKGGDLLARCNLARDGLQQCFDLNSTQPGFEIHSAAFSPKNDGALFMGGSSGQPLKAFYADMRGDIRQAVALHDEGDAIATIASTAFGPDGSKLFLQLKSAANTSLYLIDLQGQRPGAPQPLSGKGLVTWAAWQPSQTAL